jgi:transmembrane sensor
MSTSSQRDLDRIEDAACDWLVRRDAGLSPLEQQELDAWLAADPRHYAAFAALETTFDSLHAAGAQPASAPSCTSSARLPVAESRRRFSPAYLAWAAVLLVGVFLGFRFIVPSTAPEAGIATIRPRPEQRVLPDGSIVQLNANSDIAVEFTPARRDIRLLKGEAHFAVTKDPTRPFIVTTGSVEVRAVGTAFSVRLDPERVNVLVTEGRVAVAQTVPIVPSASSAPVVPEPVFVAAGGRVEIPIDASPTRPAVQSVTPLQMTTALAWREARYEFTNTALSEAVRLFNEKSAVKLEIGDSSIGDTRISGVYWADNAEGFALLLESSVDISSTRVASDRIVLSRRR